MTPALCTSIASRLFAYRWWFLGCSVMAFLSFAAALSLALSPALTAAAAALVGPLVVGPWALLCACVWFHPERGNLQSSSRVVGRLPSVVQSAIRWYAALFLALFAIVGVVVWPALSFAWL